MACFSYDAQGVIHQWNRASEALWGIPAVDAVFKQMYEVLESVDKDGAELFVQRVFWGEELADVEWKSRESGRSTRVALHDHDPAAGFRRKDDRRDKRDHRYHVEKSHRAASGGDERAT